MGVSASSSGFDGLADMLRQAASGKLEDAMVDAVVARAQEMGEDHVDNINVTIDTTEIKVDEARVLRRANELLGGGSPMGGATPPSSEIPSNEA